MDQESQPDAEQQVDPPLLGDTFIDATEKAKVAYVGHSQTTAFFDSDNDGWLDVTRKRTFAW